MGNGGRFKKTGYGTGKADSSGHLESFKNDGMVFKFRDNESVESIAENHPKADDQAIAIWHK